MGDDNGFADDAADSTTDGLDALVQEYDLEDQELADAFATIMQRKRKPPGAGSPSSGKGQPVPFRGEMSFDKAKETRKTPSSS